MSEDKVALLFNGFWMAVAISLWVFTRRLTFEERKKWHPRLSVGVGVLFIAAVVAMSLVADTKWSSPWLPVFSLAVLCVGVAGIIWLNITCTKFCGSCKAAVTNPNWFQKFEYCSKCGAKFS